MGDEPAAPVDAANSTGGGFKKRVRKDNGRARKTGAGLGSGDAAEEGDGEGGSAVVRVVKARKESALGASTATRKEEVNVHRTRPQTLDVLLTRLPSPPDWAQTHV
jgi:hypothetical protein